MATASVSNVFAPATLIESAEANQNFNDLVNFLNSQVVHRDATTAFTGTPSGPAADPVSDNQFTRKRYVDIPYILTVSTGFSAVSSSVEETVTSGFVAVSSRRVTATATGCTLQESGLYVVIGRGEFPTDAGGTRRALNLKSNGSGIGAQVFPKGTVDTSGFGAASQVVNVQSLPAGAVISVHYSQNSGGALSSNFRLALIKIPGTS